MNDHQFDVFVLDDDPSIGRFLAFFLKKRGLNYCIFSNAKEMIVKLKEGNLPKLCFIDLNLTSSNSGEGYSLMLALKKNSAYPSTMVAVSRRNSPEDIEQAFVSGAKEYIQKPIDPITLEALLSKYFDEFSSSELPLGSLSEQFRPCQTLHNFEVVSISNEELTLTTKTFFSVNSKIRLEGPFIFELSGKRSLKALVVNVVEESDLYRTVVKIHADNKSLVSVRKWVKS